MNLSWESSTNELFLNPRLPEETRIRFESVWKTLAVNGQVGIATSGSSGDSHGRLIVLSKSALLVNARAVNEHFRADSGDIWMKTLPDFHVGGLGIHARAHLSGAKVIESSLERWDASKFAKELSDSKATLLSLVPTQLFDLVALRARAPICLRAIIIGGGRLEATLHERALELGWRVHPSYGMTECGSQVATSKSPEDPRLMPLSHVEVRVDHSERIEIKSDALLTGAFVFNGDRAEFSDPKRDGWFKTEDRGRIEADGSLTVFGRTVDFVKIGGEGVLMSRLEEALDRLRPAEFDVAVLAARDERLGASVVLVAATEDRKRLQDLADRFNASVLPFEKIREIHQVKQIPRSALGKLLRAEALALVGLQPPANV